MKWLKHRIGVIGDKDSVLPFKIFGFEVKFANNEDEVKASYHFMIKNNVGIIYITERCSKYIEDSIEKYKNEMFPIVVLIPDCNGALGIGKNLIQKNVEKAVGQNIL